MIQNISRVTTVIILLGTLFFSLLPVAVSAQDPTINSAGDPVGLVPCTNDCTFSDLVQLGQNILNYLVFISAIAAAGGFMWAGWLYFTSAGNEGQVSQARDIFKNIALGFIFVLGAWLIVYTITSSLGVSSENILLSN